MCCARAVRAVLTSFRDPVPGMASHLSPVQLAVVEHTSRNQGSIDCDMPNLLRLLVVSAL